MAGVTSVVDVPFLTSYSCFFASISFLSVSSFFSTDWDLTALFCCFASVSSASWRFTSSSRLLISSGREIAGMRTALAASSIKSTALSGKNRSPIYREESFTADLTASSLMETLWNASYLSLVPLSISTASSGLGSLIKTGWNRLSSARSFSIYLRYSVIVVVPIVCISPRAREGFKIFDASIAPPEPPAPTKLCSSSINKMIWPCDAFTSLISAWKRFSNSPRWDAPASIPVRSRESIRLFNNGSGTFPWTMRMANPSTTAVFPTPASPISTGLFLFLRERICMMRSISFERAITGSSLPSCAICVRSVAYSLIALLACFSSSPSFLMPIFFLSTSDVIPFFAISCAASPSPSSASPSRMCSGEINSYPNRRAIGNDNSRTFLTLGENFGDSTAFPGLNDFSISRTNSVGTTLRSETNW